MAIKEAIELTGDDTVKQKIADLKTAAQSLTDQINQVAGTQAGAGFDKFTVSIGDATGAMTEHATSVRGASEAYHILAPILREVGVSLGEFRGLAILGRETLAGLALAAGGALVIALANVEEAAARTKASLSSLFGSQALGGEAIAALKSAADGLNTTVEGLAPAFKSATEALQEFNQAGRGFRTLAGVDLPQGIAGNINDTAAAIENLVKVIRTSGDTEAQAETSANAFFAAIKNGGKLTADALKQFDPGVVKLLAEAFGKGGESAQAFIAQVKLAPIPINDVINALARFGPQATDAFDALAVKSFHDELSGLLHDVQDGFKNLTGVSFSAFLVGEFQKIRIAIQATIQGIIAFQEFLAKPAGTGLSELNARFKQIDDDAKAALESVNKLDQAVEKSPFIQAPTAGATFAPPGAVTAPEEIIPIPKPRPADLEAAVQPIIDANQKAADHVGLIWAEAGVDIETGLQTGIQENPPDFSSIVTALETTGQQLATTAQTIWENLKSILSQAITVPVQASLEGAAPQFARGGLVSGSGTGTSDSIMAMLSNREFVVNARSTEFYGPGFFAALNAMLVPRDLLPGFAMGGLVKAIASSPGQSARTPIVLNIDRHSFNMTATDDVAAALQTLSVSEQMSAAGRSPGWRRS